MWVFREGKNEISTRQLIGELVHVLRHVRLSDDEAIVDALIRSGELESALTDSVFPASETAIRLTDSLAHALMERDPEALRAAQAQSLELCGQPVPDQILVSPAEGFAFYALQPADFAIAAAAVAPRADHVGIIGIRSIGTTLSALSRTALRRRGAVAKRITVRPTGHPFDRVTHFDAQQLQWIATLNQQGADFVITDEGPGMSGSSFLSVAEALEAQGIAPRRIHLIGSREPDVESLCARDAARRWCRYDWHRATPKVLEKYGGHAFFGAGSWRALHFPEQDWPASWTQMERLKFLSCDGSAIFKFEGLGRFGNDVRERSMRLAEAGFSPLVANAGDGMSAYSYISGTPLSSRDLTPDVLRRMAAYCAFRRNEFPVVRPSRERLPDMVKFNLEQEFEARPPAVDLGLLISSRPQVVDARMHPHEWMRTPDMLWKHDSSLHGDDHFFPGPTDIAWDLAGAVVEWNLDSSATDCLLSEYAKLAGDDPRERIPAYLLAYSVFRMGYCKMAAGAERGTTEAPRLQRAYRFYRQLVENQIAGAQLSTAA